MCIQRLDAKILEEDDLQFAQKHLRISSGLYGLVRPLDLMQPYRLEMGTKLEKPGAVNLIWTDWGDSDTLRVNKALKKR